MSYEKMVTDLTATATRQKRTAAVMAAWLKSGKAKKFLDPVAALKGMEHVSTVQWVSCGQLYIYVYVKELKGFNGIELMSLLNVWEYMNPSRNAVNDYPQNVNRVFTFEYYSVHVESGFDSPISLVVNVTIDATAASDSPTCRKVVTGYTDGKPQPIYKIECDEPVEESAVTFPYKDLKVEEVRIEPAPASVANDVPF